MSNTTFRPGEKRPAWVLSFVVGTDQKVSEVKIERAIVKTAGHISRLEKEKFDLQKKFKDTYPDILASAVSYVEAMYRIDKRKLAPDVIEDQRKKDNFPLNVLEDAVTTSMIYLNEAMLRYFRGNNLKTFYAITKPNCPLRQELERSNCYDLKFLLEDLKPQELEHLVAATLDQPASIKKFSFGIPPANTDFCTMPLKLRKFGTLPVQLHMAQILSGENNYLMPADPYSIIGLLNSRHHSP